MRPPSPRRPARSRPPPKNLRYGHTGFHELGLLVDDIDAFFEKVRAAGYETQTEYVWQCADIGRSFLFYDKDGNMIQIWQNAGEARWK
jgi:catechol 2,3-dioxygenase-like lactoylglutathione lyase family enzyme